MIRRNVIALLAAALPVAARAAQRNGKKDPSPVQSEVNVMARITATAQELMVEYRAENRRADPVLIFDRLWDLRKEALDPNWVYVEASGRRVFLRRQMELRPALLHVEQPPVPYGRELAPGASLQGKFSIPSNPVYEAGAYYSFTHRGKPVQMPVDQAVFELGWAVKPAPGSLPPSIKPVELNGETLWLLPYGTVAHIQKIAAAPPVDVALVVSGQR
jgi:hypothetical protein